MPQGFLYGFYDGITGVVMLPYKGAKGAGLKGLGIGILHGLGGLILKPLTGNQVPTRRRVYLYGDPTDLFELGIWSLIGHPIFGLSKHISNRKASRQQQDSSELV